MNHVGPTPRPSPVEIVEARHDAHLRLDVRGEIDIATHDRLTDLLTAVDLADVTAVDLGLGAVEFCDSHGVRQLLDFAVHAESVGCTVTMHGARPQLVRLLALLDTSAAA